MRKIILRGIWGILVVFFAFSGMCFAERNKEIGVVDYQKFQWMSGETNRTDAKYKNYTLPLFNAIKELGYTPEWVSMDIFLPENKAERDKYKRIVISCACAWFTPEMYEGMTDYVKNGGLLITNESLFGIDANRNYKNDEGDTYMKGGNPLVGVYGHSSVYMTKIKVESVCPLTEGLTSETWIELGEKIAGRRAINKGAYILIISDSIYKEQPSNNQPFLTFKNSGKGACIYIVPNLGSVKNKYLSIILKNSLSEKTLEWLVAGNE